MTLPEFLTQDKYGWIHLTGHRIGLLDMVYYYNEGYSPEMLQERFPTLPLALIHHVIAFYLENQNEVDEYCRTCNAEMEKQRAAASKGPTMDELQRRLQAIRRAKAS